MVTDPRNLPSNARPDAHWMEYAADGGGLIFYILRVRPDVGFEFLGSALFPLLGLPFTSDTDIDTETVLARIDPEHAEPMRESFLIEPGEETTVDLLWRHVDGHGVYSRAWMRARQRPDGSVVHEGVVQDVTELREAEEKLRRSEEQNRLLAATDPITGVWNRRRCTELIADEIAQVDRHGHTLSLLMLDVDYFKTVNDTYGHHAGDAVLFEIARRLIDGVRSTDAVARWGGEEFVVLLRNCDLADAVTTAEKLRQNIAGTPFAEVGTISVSVGAAQLHACEELGDLLRRADAALYRAKASGRNTVVDA